MRLTHSIKITAATAAALAAAVVATGTASAAPHHGVTAAQVRQQITGKHTYNPHARLGSVDNPIIISGGKQDQKLALLTPAQLKALNKMKKDLEAQARNHKPAVKPNLTMKPMGYNCAAEEGLYWCDQENTSYGTWDEGTYLGSDHHEYLEAKGNAPGRNFQTYVDQTWNNGQNWNGPTGQVTNQPWGWTPSFYDGPGYQDRGCLYDMDHSLVACGPWH